MSDVKRYAAGALYEWPRPGGEIVVMARDYDALTAERDRLAKDAERLRGELLLITQLQAGDGSTVNGLTKSALGRAFRMAQDIATAAIQENRDE